MVWRGYGEGIEGVSKTYDNFYSFRDGIVPLHRKRDIPYLRGLLLQS